MINLLNLPAEEIDKYLMLEEASAQYEIPIATLRDWVKLKKISYIKLRGRVMVSKADLDLLHRFYVAKPTRRKSLVKTC